MSKGKGLRDANAAVGILVVFIGGNNNAADRNCSTIKHVDTPAPGSSWVHTKNDFSSLHFVGNNGVKTSYLSFCGPLFVCLYQSF